MPDQVDIGPDPTTADLEGTSAIGSIRLGLEESDFKGKDQSTKLGAPKPLNGPVKLVPYDPEWPVRFGVLAERIRASLQAGVLQLEHVGSTSVEGLSAKPIIDLLLAVRDSADEGSYVPSLEPQGFVLRRREPDWFEHRLLKHTEIPCNLHVFTIGCPEIDRMLAFRDWLRSTPEDRRLYEATKHRLAVRTWRYLQDYADAKTEVVEEILGRAMA